MNRNPEVVNNHPARVLIVDDEPYNRQLLVVMLTPEGYVLPTAASGEEALAMVKREPPDLILLDVMMPGMDGYQLIARLKNNAETRHIPIIMVTALDHREATMQALRTGAEDLLTKPVDRAEVCMRVRNLLRLKAYGDYYGKYSEMLEGQVAARTAELVERTKALERQAAVLTEQAALLDLAPDAILVRNLQNQIVYWNHGAEVLYGWLAAEALGRDARELLRADLSGQVEAQFQEQGQWEGEVIHYARDGSKLIVASRWTMQRDADGVPVRILTISNDITARKEAVQALEQLSQRTQRRERILTTTLSFISDYAYIFDREGRFLFANQPLLDRWEMTLEQGAGKTFFELPYPAELAGKLTRQVREVFETKRRLTDEIHSSHPGGLESYYEYIFSPVLGADGRVEFVAGSTRDITDRKRAEDNLRTARDAAEAANRAKSEFLANMSHEIRTPMNGVIGMTDLLLDTELTASQRDNLGIVKSSADGLLSIIDDILDFSRIEAHRLELEPMDFRVRDFIADTAKAMALRVRQKGLELIVDVGPTVPGRLIGDCGRLGQILINLLGNAIKFTHRGEIVLSVTADEATLEDGVVLHVSVRDTGVGIPLDSQVRVFEAFRQADNSTTRTYGGTGLGLTISAQLVELMGGRLWVESETGRGSTFHFTANLSLPKTPAVTTPAAKDANLRGVPVAGVEDNGTSRRARPAARERRELVRPCAPQEACQAGRILVVEDNLVNQLVATRMLETRGHTVVVANNGREALALLNDPASPRFECVLMDIQMPLGGRFGMHYRHSGTRTDNGSSSADYRDDRTHDGKG